MRLFVKHIDYFFCHLYRKAITKRHDVFVADDFGNATNIGTDNICSATKSFSADQRQAFVKARKHKYINAVHQCRHLLRGDIA